MIIYTPFTKKEDHEIEELPFEVDLASSIIFDDNQNLHILGGTKKPTQHWMIQWAKNKADRKIVKVGNLPNPCKYSGVCCADNKLYIMGNYDAPKQNSLWIHDVTQRTWKNGADLPMNRSGFGCHLVNNNQEIIVIGNRYGSKGGDSDVILLYNIQEDKWRKAATKLKHKIGFHASVLMKETGEIHGFSGYSDGANIATHFIVKYKSS